MYDESGDAREVSRAASSDRDANHCPPEEPSSDAPPNMPAGLPHDQEVAGDLRLFLDLSGDVREVRREEFEFDDCLGGSEVMPSDPPPDVRT